MGAQQIVVAFKHTSTRLFVGIYGQAQTVLEGVMPALATGSR